MRKLLRISILSILLLASLSVSSQSYNVFFEETFSSSVPTGWTGDFYTSGLLENWVLHTGATSTADTGPDAAYDSTHYVYMESSAPAASGDSYAIQTPMIDVPAGENSQLVFHYHMHGDDMGTLNVIVSHNNVDSTVFTISGEQHATGDVSLWQEEIIDLQAYNGESVMISFQGVKGPSSMGDMAIDLVQLRQYVAPIPTLGEWSIMILGLLLTTLGLAAIRSHSRETTTEVLV